MALKISVTTSVSGPSFSDSITFPLECSACGHESKHRIAEAKDDPVLICPSCGAKTQIESGGTLRQAADEIEKLDRLFDDLTKG